MPRFLQLHGPLVILALVALAVGMLSADDRRWLLAAPVLLVAALAAERRTARLAAALDRRA